MTFDVWWTIARRQMQYKQLLAERLTAWRRERVATLTDLREIERVIKLCERMERHEQRIDRHQQRSLPFLAALPVVGGLN